MESLNSTSHPLNLSTSQPLNLSGGVSTSQPAFRLYSSTACVHFYCLLSCCSTFLCAHPYGIPAPSACITTNLQHSLHAFLLYPSTIFQHCMRAFLIYSSTFLVAFTHVCMCLYVFVPYTIYHPLHLLSSAYYPLCVFPLCTLCSMAPTLSAHCVQWCISKFENFQYSYLLSDREFGSRHLIFKY